MSSSDSTPAPNAPKKVRLLRLNAIMALPILILPALLAYYFMIDGVVREQVLAQSVSLAGYNGNAEVESVSFTIFGPKLRISELRAFQDIDGKRHEVLYVGEAHFDVEFWPLLERRLVVNELTASRIKYESPLPPPPPPAGTGAGGGTTAPEESPPETANDYVNDYLKKVDEFLKSDEYRQGKEWLEKLRHYMDERAAEEEAARLRGEVPMEPGLAGRAPYVLAEMRKRGDPPSVIVKNAGIRELEFVLGSAGNKQLGSKLSNVELTAQSVTSDPVSYRLPMEFKAGGDLDGDKNRRVELGLVVRFDPVDLVKLEQVKGAFTIARLPLEGLVDTSSFGEVLDSAELSLVHYASEHAGMGGRTRLLVSGAITPPGFSLPGKPSKLTVSLWFGGFPQEQKFGAFLPSGLGISVENMALDRLLEKAGGFPLPLTKGATFSFGTCDERGLFDTPQAAVTWHNGFRLFLRLNFQNLRFDESAAKGKQALGLPADLLAKGLNRVLDGMSKDGRQFELIAGFSGKAKEFRFGIERPGLRTFVDACINALYLTGDDIKGLVELPFEVTKDGTIGLSSVDKTGARRAPVFDVDQANTEGLSDLRVSLSLAGLTIAPKAGQQSIAGLPADEFCSAFNTFMANQGDGGVRFRCRVFNDRGTLSPALESPGLRGLVDALVSVFSYSGLQLNQKYNLPFTLPDDLKAQLRSVNADGSMRSFSSNGADSDSLADLRISMNVDNARISPKTGEGKIFGLPARDFCDAFNRFSAAQSGSLKLTLRAFDAKTSFSPALESPGTRGLVDAVIGAFSYSGRELNERFSLPFLVNESTTAKLESVGADGSVRTISSPGSEGSDLSDLRVALNLLNAQISPKPGQDKILGLPAKEFCAGFNQYSEKRKNEPLRLTLRVFDGQNSFSPALESPGTRGLLDAVINTLTFSGKQINETFDLPFTVHELSSLRSMSVTADGKPRDEKSPGNEASDLKNLHVMAFVTNLYAVKKPGQDKILGIPADYFLFAWNAFVSSFPPTGFPLTFRVFDDAGKFEPSLAGPSTQVLLTMLGNSVGISAFEKNFGQIDAKFKNAFEAFKKGDMSKVGDIGKAVKDGKDIEIPKEIPKEVPKELPKLPKLPWG